jgi:hypothetical protein
MKNVFIAIGGSGTKVAEALVRLLGLGFPIKSENNILTSAGEQLEIWRVDPDAGSGASSDLKKCVEEYQKLQQSLDVGWCLNVKSQVHLNPLDLPKRDPIDNQVRTLRGILNSGLPNRPVAQTQPLLDLFYTPQELDVEISRGFYQKPFIGSAVMAIYADSLRSSNRTAERETTHADALQALQNQDVRFFICGSLHGGTGASGVSVFGHLLNDEQASVQAGNEWKVAACLLAPYFQPPPPFSVPADAATYTDEQILEWFEQKKPPAASKFSAQEKKRAFRQIAGGFYADTGKLVERAKHNLSFYDSKLQDYFEQIYIIGKPKMDDLVPAMWSNGGSNQRNPLNSAEVIAAVAALRYFSGAELPPGEGNYILASSHEHLAGDGMGLHNLPKYQVGAQTIDPERVVLATVAARFLVAHEILWDVPVGQLEAGHALKSLYERTPLRRDGDKEAFGEAARIIRDFTEATFDTAGGEHPKSAGWHDTVWQQLSENMPTDVAAIAARKSSLAGERNWYGRMKVDPAAVGHSSWQVKFQEFHRWSAAYGGQFSRGGYFRHIWAQIYGDADLKTEKPQPQQ